jgi:hypothetical protein
MARNFNGTSDRIDFPDHSGLDWTTVMSVACWVWRDVSNAFQGICSHTAGTVGSNGWWFSIGDNVVSNVAFLTFNDTDHFGTTAITTGGWRHLVATYDGANVRLYVNGVLDNTVAETAAVTNAAATFKVGAEASFYAPSWFDGKLADLGFWPGATLNAREIAALARGVSPRLIRPGSLQLYAPLWGTHTAEPDFSVNRRTGTLTGTSQYVPHAPVIPFTKAPTAPVIEVAPPPPSVTPWFFQQQILRRRRAA